MMRRIVALMLCLIALGPGLPARGSSPTTAVSDNTIPRLRFAEQLERLGAPARLVERIRYDDDTVFTGSIVWADPAGDLDRDHINDVLLTTLHYRFEIPDDIVLYAIFGYSFDGRTKVEAISGASGRRLWIKRHDGFASALPAEIGAPPEAGVLWMFGTQMTTGPVTEGEVVVEALDRRAKPQWRRAYPSRYVQTTEGQAIIDSPLWIDVGQLIGNDATDLLVTEGTYTATYGGQGSVSTVSVVDGSEGEATDHPTMDVGTNWDSIGWLSSDLDDDGYQDYVVSQDNGPGTNDTLHARRGPDGGEIWTTAGHEFSEVAWVYNVADLNGNGTKDMLISTRRGGWQSEFVDGKHGRPAWWTRGLWPYSPGDIDHDGSDDVISRAVNHSEKAAVVKLWARNGKGNVLWKRIHRTGLGKNEPCREGICFTFMGTGFGEIGDLDLDGAVDMFVHHEIDRQPGDDKVVRYTVSGADGQITHERGKNLYPVTGSLDGTGADLTLIDIGDQRVTIRALDGRDASQLWETTVRVAGSLPKQLYTYLMPAKIDADECGDVIVVLDNNKTSLVLALTASGSLKWSRTRGVTLRGATVEGVAAGC